MAFIGLPCPKNNTGIRAVDAELAKSDIRIAEREKGKKEIVCKNRFRFMLQR
jgi:hypothetical protein